MLHPVKFGLAAGIVWGLQVALITLYSAMSGYGKAYLLMLADLYPGYDVSLAGSLVGLGYGFLFSFIGFALFAWVYNILCCCCKCCNSSSCSCSCCSGPKKEESCCSKEHKK